MCQQHQDVVYSSPALDHALRLAGWKNLITVEAVIHDADTAACIQPTHHHSDLTMTFKVNIDDVRNIRANATRYASLLVKQWPFEAAGQPPIWMSLEPKFEQLS